MLHRPAPQPDVLAILEAYLAINGMSGRVVSCLAVTYAAFRAMIVPKGNYRLLGGGRHALHLIRRTANGAVRPTYIPADLICHTAMFTIRFQA